MSGFVVDAGAIDAMFRNPVGPVAKGLESAADRVVAAAKIYVGVQHPTGRGKGGQRPRPYRRSGDLQDSIRREDARVGTDGLSVECVAPAIHRGWYYNQVLRDPGLPNGGYQLVDLGALAV